MEPKPNKFWAVIFILAGGVLVLTGFAALAGFLGLPFFRGGNILNLQIGATATIFLGLGCGSLAVLHGFGMLFDRPSRNFNLPPSYFFWILFGLVLGLGNILLNAKVAVNFVFPVTFLLGAALPTLAVLAQGAHRLGTSATWRDASLMFVAGSTISIFTAIILEGILPYLAYLLLAPLGILAEGFSSLAFGAPGFIERIFFSPLIVVFLIFTAFQAPIPEEFAKALGPGLMRRRIQNERQAFIVGLASGAGFAVLENMLYEGLYAQWSGWSWGGITLLRGFGSILHPLCTGIIALALSRARTNGRGWLATVGPAYLLSVGLHTLWNGGFEPLVYLTGLDTFMGSGPSFSFYGTYVEGLLIVFLVALSLGLWLYFNRILNQLGQGVEIELVPAFISRRALAGIALAAVALFVPIGAMLGPAWENIQAAAVGGLPTSTPTITPIPTFTPVPTLTPTSTPTATPLFEGADQDYFATATAFPQGSPVLVDNFDMATGWEVGNFGDSYAKGVRKIEKGAYLWSATAQNGVFVWTDRSDYEPLDRFYLAVDIIRQSPGSLSSGLVFRAHREQDTYYVFRIKDSLKTFMVSIHLPVATITIIDWTYTASLRDKGANRLTVLADGSRYILFINGQYVGGFVDDRLKGGSAGVGIGLDAGESANFEFDNFELDYKP